MKDLQLDENGDLYFGENIDVSITDSVKQAIEIRLRWFFTEWRLGPSLGVPYYEDFFIKKYNMLKMRADIRAALLSVEEVTAINSLEIKVDAQMRIAKVRFSVSTTQGVYESEVELWNTVLRKKA